ncbi:MAG: sulfotransferase domain-containing protein [Gammaproteobacteria bacterium]|nr:sulfotransferase domain-containing protein [Gammaproteobacteria bacterium]MCW8840446.1 sulfotransferase domain-containing protein [Gammaproteobacteria bacterium]MCW8959142.1 sulfotransferase domain-containing protein [Gammaproteobacteria bacterium]MCW8993303.1 sulfotransferase domain-containing protein [Gammaproteobacteria bacterium]
MLIVCNGVYKSGSTWVFTMLLELVGQNKVHSDWLDENQPLNIDILKDPDGIVSYSQDHDVIVKIHSYEKPFLEFLREKNARIVVTRRSHVDILLSHYHHFSNEKIRLPFVLYAMSVGFVKMLEVAIYEKIAAASKYADIVISYNDLHANPGECLSKIVSQLGLPYSSAEVTDAAIRADMRGKDFGEKFVGKDNREWFFRRNRTAYSKRTKKVVAKAIVFFARVIVSVTPLRSVLYYVATRDSRRGQFAATMGDAR